MKIRSILANPIMGCGLFVVFLFSQMGYAQTVGGNFSFKQAIDSAAQTQESTQFVIHRGDALNLIAQYYSRVNNVSFESALKELKAANSSAFEDAQYNLKLGATFILPAVQAKKNTAVPETAQAVVAATTPAQTIESAQTTSTPAPVVETTPVAPQPFISDSNPKPITLFFGLELWAWCLLVVAALMGLIGLMRKLGGRTDSLQSDVKRHDNGAPKVVLGQNALQADSSLDINHALPSHTIKPTQAYLSGDTDEDDLPILDDEPMNTPILDARFSQALGGLSATSLDLTQTTESDVQQIVQNNSPKPEVDVDYEQHKKIRSADAENNAKALFFDLKTPQQRWNALVDVPEQQPRHNFGASVPEHNPQIEESTHKDVFRNAIAQYRHVLTPELSNNQINDGMFYDFKTPMQRWGQLGIQVVDQAVSAAAAKVEALAAVHVSDEVLEAEKIENPMLDIDMSKFLHDFSRNIPEPTYTSVDYEDLLDRTRLQAWLNMHTPEQILLYAQDAHDARYDDVAQLMLNDVLLRGNAEQYAAVLDLRYLWSYPQGVY